MNLFYVIICILLRFLYGLQNTSFVIVDIFIPCFIDQLFPQTGFNMVKILQKANCDVNYNPAQTCCGQPAFNAGFTNEAGEIALKFMHDFELERYIVCPSASCVGFIRNNYPKLLKGKVSERILRILHEKTYELSEFLVDVLKVEDIGAKFEGIATYHDSCSALRECGIKTAPRKLLQQVKGLTLQELPSSEVCCGFGGTFAVKFEPISIAMAEQKVDNIIASTQAQYIISTDLSCLMHLDGYIQKNQRKLKVLHLADVLASGLD